MCQNSFSVGNSSSGISDRIQKTKDFSYNSPTNNGQSKKVGIIVAVSAIIIVAALAAGIVFSIKGGKRGFRKKSKVREWRMPTVSKYVAFAGSKGPVVWEILNYTFTGLDSAKHAIRIIDPVKDEVISEKSIGNATTWEDDRDFYKKLGYEFMLLNDTVYNASEEGGLQGFDLYTGERLLSNENFEKKYSELKAGIVKVKARNYRENYSMLTKNGDEYFYYPRRKILRNKDEEDNAYRTDTVTKKNFYFTRGPKSELYLITKKESSFESEYLSDIYIKNYLSGESYYKNIFKTFEKIGNRSYPYAQRLVSTPDHIVIAYLSDFSKNADPIIEKIDRSGKTVWQNKDEALKFFVKNIYGDNLNLKSSDSKNELVFYGYSVSHRSLGIDLNSGKTIFIHSQERKTE